MPLNSSQRAELRQLKITDLDALIELESDPETVEFTSITVPWERQETERRLKHRLQNEENMSLSVSGPLLTGTMKNLQVDLC